MQTTIGIAIGVLIAIAGFIGFSLLGPQTASAPQEEKAGITDLIVVDSPTKGQKISSPVTLTGSARGTWYFEASFPIDILDEDGNKIGQGYAEAQGDWMTENFVAFTGTVTFTSPASGSGIVRLMKDNASGLPEHDRHLDVPVTF